MAEIDLYRALQREDLFALFKEQLQKDFEGAGLNAGFVVNISCDYALLKEEISEQVRPLQATQSYLQALLYRVDLSEAQIIKSMKTDLKADFIDVISELIIKRILQKIIFKKKFSGNYDGD